MVISRAVAAMFLASGASACMFIVPKDGRYVAHRELSNDPPEVIGTAMPVVEGHADGTAIAIQSKWMRTCEYHAVAHVEYRDHTGASFKVYDPCGGSSGDSCGYALAFAILAAPITLAVSGLVTLGVVASASDHSERIDEPQPVQRAACSAPGADFQLLVSVPGRPAIPVRTDEFGRARVDLGDPKAVRAATIQIAPGTLPR